MHVDTGNGGRRRISQFFSQFFSQFLCRIVVVIVVLLVGGTGRAHAQGDAQELLNQLTALMEKVQAADDPCPYMPQFKSLMGQFAQQSPEMYQAMKPTLDLLNHDDTCGGSGGSTTRQVPIDGGMAAPPVPSASASASGGSTLDLSGNVSLASQLLGQPGVTSRCFVDKGVSQCEYFKNGTWLGTELVCPASGFWGMKQTGDTAVGLRCTPGQPVGGGGSITGPSGGSGSGGGSVSGGGSGSGGGGSGSNPGGVPTVSGLDQCVQASYNADNVLAYTDTCNISITAVWFVGSRSGEGDLTSGQRVNTGYTADEIRQGNLKIYSYACPLGYRPIGPDGQFVTAGSTYSCAKR